MTYYEQQSFSYLIQLVLGKEEQLFLETHQINSRKVMGKVKFYKSYGEVGELIANANGVFSFALYSNTDNEKHDIIGILCNWKENEKSFKVIKQIEVEKLACKVDEFGLNYYKTKLSDENLLKVTDEKTLSCGNNYHFRISGVALPRSVDDPGVFAFVLSDGKKQINGDESHVFSAL